MIAYTADKRAQLRKGALLELTRLTGASIGAEPERWSAWVAARRPYERTQPWTTRLDFEPDSETLLRRVME